MKKKTNQPVDHRLGYAFVILAGTLAAVLILNAAGIGGGYDGYQAKTVAQDQTVEDQVIKHEVQTAVSVLQAIHTRQKNGEFSEAVAKKLAANVLRDMRYGDDDQGYFWVDTVDGVNVVLYGRKDVEGKNRYKAQEKGVYYIQEIIKQAKNGGGYTNYWFPKMGETVAKEKRAYSELFEPYNWVVGTGYYLEDRI